MFGRHRIILCVYSCGRLISFLDECLELVYTAGPLDAGQASNQP